MQMILSWQSIVSLFFDGTTNEKRDSDSLSQKKFKLSSRHIFDEQVVRERKNFRRVNPQHRLLIMHGKLCSSWNRHQWWINYPQQHLEYGKSLFSLSHLSQFATLRREFSLQISIFRRFTCQDNQSRLSWGKTSTWKSLQFDLRFHHGRERFCGFWIPIWIKRARE